MKNPIAIGLVAAAGKAAEELTESGVAVRRPAPRRAGTPTARVADQDRDGVSAEIIYPTVGMMLCNHPDFDYKQACFQAYNRWIAEYCSDGPDRLLGMRPDRDAHASTRASPTSRRSRPPGCAA